MSILLDGLWRCYPWIEFSVLGDQRKACTDGDGNGLGAYLQAPSQSNSSDAKVIASCDEKKANLLISSGTLVYSVMNK